MNFYSDMVTQQIQVVFIQDLFHLHNFYTSDLLYNFLNFFSGPRAYPKSLANITSSDLLWSNKAFYSVDVRIVFFFIHIKIDITDNEAYHRIYFYDFKF